jgi:hypothetical protein
MFINILLIVLNVLAKNDDFKYCSFNIKHFYQNIIHEGENEVQKENTHIDTGYFSRKHRQRLCGRCKRYTSGQ